MPSSTTGYERIPSEPERSPSPRKAHGVDEESEVVDRASAEKRALAAAQLREQERALAADPRFNPEAPSVWKRVALILFLIFMFWLAVRMRLAQVPSQANVVYADRYSEQHKFRPAASPVITEVLKDGKTRIRGAAPTAAAYVPMHARA